MNNEIILRLGIWDFNDISHKEISNSLSVEPTKEYFKGQKRSKNVSAISKKNGWLFQPTLNLQLSFEEQLDKLLSIIVSKKDVLEVYCRKYYCEISCAVYIYYDNEESIPSVHFNKDQLQVLKELKIEFDLDIYCLPNTN